MKNALLVVSLVLFTSFTTTIVEDETAIRKVLEDQRQAWNNYDLEGFMQGYWKRGSRSIYQV